MNNRVVNNTLIFEGELTQKTARQASEQVRLLLKKHKVNMLDLSGISKIDSAGVACLDEIHALIGAESALIIFSGVSDEVQAVINTFSSLKLKQIAPPTQAGFFEKVGESFLQSWKSMVEALTLASEIVYFSALGIFNRRSQRKGSFTQQCILLGSQALPIVALLSLIIGFILSLQSGVQLKNFGANVFIADLLAITMVREMGPLLTAIIMAGRSGSAIASEIATMQVTEEIDALRMMALHPVRYIVVPKFHAFTVVMPILVAFSILVSEIGGMIIAVGFLDLSLETFVTRSIEIIALKDLIISFGKSIWFAWVIVVIGSYYGFQVKGGAEGVGKSTTASVVASIFAVIMFDAVFSLMYL